jgi:hypothetical protein
MIPQEKHECVKQSYEERCPTETRRAVITMLHKASIDAQEWTTVYEDNSRKIQARGEERRAIDSSTGKIIIEYSL